MENIGLHYHLFNSTIERENYLALNDSGETGTGTPYYNEPLYGFTCEDSAVTYNKIPSVILDKYLVIKSKTGETVTYDSTYCLYDISVLTYDIMTGLCNNVGVLNQNEKAIEHYTFTLTINPEITVLGIGFCSGLTYLTEVFFGAVPNYNNSDGTFSIVKSEITGILQQKSFYGCTRLKKINLPSGIYAIGASAFTNCYSLEEFHINTRNGGWPRFDNQDNRHYDGFVIYGGAFQNCSSLTIVTGTKYIEQINKGAFQGCESLDYFKFYDGFENSAGGTTYLTSIGDNAFDGCTNLHAHCRHLIIPDCVTNIGSAAFKNATSNIDNITLGTDLTSVGSNAFSGFTKNYIIKSASLCATNITTNSATFHTLKFGNYTSVDIVSPVTTIGQRCFNNVSSLVNAKIENNVETIGASAFTSCNKLSAISISNQVTVIPNYCFKGCVGFKEFVVPNNIIEIQDASFHSCSNITSLSLSENLISIGASAFTQCKALTSLTIPDFVETIGNYGFSYCGCALTGGTTLINPQYSQINSIIFGSSLQNIGDYAFSYLNYGDKVTPPTSITPISIFLKNNVEIVGKRCFDHAVINSFEISSSGITSVGEAVLAYCPNLTSITLNTGNTKYISEENGNIYNAILDTTTSGIVAGCINTILTDSNAVKLNNYSFEGSGAIYINNSGNNAIVIPDTVTDYGKYAFHNCYSLLSVNMTNNVKNIDEFCFNNCSSMITCMLSNTLENIGNSCFTSARTLTSIHIPSTVTAIGTSVFWWCTAITSMTVDSLNTRYTDFNNNVISEITNNGSILWYGCMNGVVPDTTEIIESHAFTNISSLVFNSITIPSGVTTIKEYAFYQCSSLATASVDTNNNVLKTIGDFAFYETNLTAFTFVQSIETIGNSAFKSTELTTVSFGDNLTDISYGAFQSCSKLTTLSLGNSVQNIGSYCFSGTAITSLTIPDSVTYIGEHGCFCACSSLTNVSIGRGITSIPEFTFYNGRSLTSITCNGYDITHNSSITRYENACLAFTKISGYSTEFIFNDNVTYIGPSVFQGVCGITKIDMSAVSSGITTLFPYFTYNCKNLRTVILGPGINTLNANCLSNMNHVIFTNANLSRNLSYESSSFVNVNNSSTSIIEYPNNSNKIYYQTAFKNTSVNKNINNWTYIPGLDE